MTKYLFKKDLILKKMTIFDDQPKSYYVWKTMFLNATAELNLSSSEIFDLLINYLVQSRGNGLLVSDLPI